MPQDTLKLKTVHVKMLFVGQTWPSPKRGHPPFLVEKEPCLALFAHDALVRIIPISALDVSNDAPALWEGTHNGKAWSVDYGELASIRFWATRRLACPPKPPAKPVPRARRTIPNKVCNVVHRKSPRAIKDAIDVDYWHKLPPEDQNWLNRALGELYANRWDDRVAEPFFAKGSEERRKLQFEYNRRHRDFLNHNYKHEDRQDAHSPLLDQLADVSRESETDIINRLDKEPTKW